MKVLLSLCCSRRKPAPKPSLEEQQRSRALAAKTQEVLKRVNGAAARRTSQIAPVVDQWEHLAPAPKDFPRRVSFASTPIVHHHVEGEPMTELRRVVTDGSAAKPAKSAMMVRQKSV